MNGKSERENLGKDFEAGGEVRGWGIGGSVGSGVGSKRMWVCGVM